MHEASLLQKCSDYQVSDKKTYSTFARTLPPSSKVSKSVVALLKKFDWNKVVLVLCQWKKDRWYQNLEAFKVRNKGFIINDTKKLSTFDPQIPLNSKKWFSIILNKSF